MESSNNGTGGLMRHVDTIKVIEEELGDTLVAELPITMEEFPERFL